MTIPIDPMIVDYIRSSSSEHRVCTTSEGPMLLPVRLKPPKPTDLIMTVGGRKLYISAVQAPRIKIIDSKMLPRCVLNACRR